ncbi:MAG: type II toxin-antitoxin system RelE/ParE family toxin [Acidobacteriota bacterium]
MYTLEIIRSAKKQMDDLEDETASRIDAVILKLAANPRPPGCKKLKAQKNTLRVRVGDYRVLYQIDESKKRVIVLGILHRREAYR